MANEENNNIREYKLIEPIGNIDLSIYKDFIKFEILTDELVLTKDRAKHIDDRRFGVLDSYKDNIIETVNAPDYIIRDKKNPDNTLIAIKKVQTIENKHTYIVIRFVIEGDNPKYKNSIITMTAIGDKKLGQIKRNKELLFSKDELGES